MTSLVDLLYPVSPPPPPLRLHGCHPAPNYDPINQDPAKDQQGQDILAMAEAGFDPTAREEHAVRRNCILEGGAPSENLQSLTR